MQAGSLPLSFPPITAFAATPPPQPLSSLPPDGRHPPPPPAAPMATYGRVKSNAFTALPPDTTQSRSPPLSFPPIASFSETPPCQPLSLPLDARHPPPPPAAPIATYRRIQSNTPTTPTALTELEAPRPDQHALLSPALIATPGTLNINNLRGELSTVLDMSAFSPIHMLPLESSWSDRFDCSALDLPLQNIQDVDVGGDGGDAGGVGGEDFEGPNLGDNSFQGNDLAGSNSDGVGGASGDDFGGDNVGGAGGDFDHSFQDLDRDPDSDLNSEDDDEPHVDTEVTRMKRKRAPLPKGKFSATQEAMLAATFEQMLAVASVCSAETGIPQERILKRFHNSHNQANVRGPHRWNLYKAYANHEMNRITEIRRTKLGANTPLTPEAPPPLTMPELKEAYPAFIKACGGKEKAQEILLKHAELAGTEEVTTYEGRQRRFTAVQRRLDGMVCSFTVKLWTVLTQHTDW